MIINNNSAERHSDKLSCKETLEITPTAWNKQKPARLPGRGLEQSHWERMLSRLVGSQQAVQCSVSSFATVIHSGVGLDDTAVCKLFLSL